MSRFVIVKTGQTVASIRESRGDFESWIAAAMGLSLSKMIVADVANGAVLPDPEIPLGVVVTGSPAMVTQGEAWSEATAVWLRSAVLAGTPVLGICYGHQLLAHALGGRVADNPRGREIGTVALRLRAEAREDLLFSAFPETVSFHASHQQSVATLPPGVRLLASSECDPHHAFAVGACTWGVQFHPEFDAEIMAGYLTARRESVEAEGIDVDQALAAVREAPEGPQLLRRFRALAEAARAPS